MAHATHKMSTIRKRKEREYFRDVLILKNIPSRKLNLGTNLRARVLVTRDDVPREMTTYQMVEVHKRDAQNQRILRRLDKK